MTYRIYIFIITQLATKNFVTIPFGNYNVFFQICDQKKDWSISLKIAHLDEDNCSQQIKECFSLRKRARFSSKGSQIVIDHIHGPGVYLLYDTKPMKRYLIFKEVLENLLEEADDFKELFCLR